MDDTTELRVDCSPREAGSATSEAKPAARPGLRAPATLPPAAAVEPERVSQHICSHARQSSSLCVVRRRKCTLTEAVAADGVPGLLTDEQTRKLSASSTSRMGSTLTWHAEEFWLEVRTAPRTGIGRSSATSPHSSSVSSTTLPKRAAQARRPSERPAATSRARIFPRTMRRRKRPRPRRSSARPRRRSRNTAAGISWRSSGASLPWMIPVRWLPGDFDRV